MAARWKTRPENLRAAIGPSIGVCCYEVGPEVARRFERWFPATTNSAPRSCRPSMKCSCGPQASPTSGNPANAHSARRKVLLFSPGAGTGRTHGVVYRTVTTGKNTSGGPLRGSARKTIRRFERIEIYAALANKIGRVLDLDLVTVDLLLALDAECRPRHRVHALGRDIFLAVQAHAIRAVRDAGQRAANLPQHVRIPIQIANRQFAFARQLHFIESVGRLLDGNFVPVAQASRSVPPASLPVSFCISPVQPWSFQVPRLLTSAWLSFVFSSVLETKIYHQSFK